MRRETQVGLLFFLVVMLLFVFTVLIGDVDLFGKYYEVTVSFEDAAGLQQGDDVRFAGVPEMGTVKELRFIQDHVEAALKLRKDIGLTDKSNITIASTTPLGGKHISIVRAPESDPGLPIPRDGSGHLTGGPPQDIMKYIDDAASIFKDAGKAINRILAKVERGEGTIGALLADEEMSSDVKRAVRSAREAIEKINEGEGLLAGLINDGDMAGDARQTIRSIRDIVERVDRGEGVLGVLTRDPESAENVKAFIRSAKETIDRIHSGEGPLARLINDEEMGKDIEAILQRLRSISEKIDEPGPSLASRLVNDAEMGKNISESVTGLKKAFSIRTILGVEQRTIHEKNYDISKAYLRIEPSDRKFYQVAVDLIDIERDSPLATPRRISKIDRKDDDPEVTADLFIGRRWLDRQISLRAGVLEGKPGGGIDLQPKWSRSDTGLLRGLRFSLEGRPSYDDRKIKEDFDPWLLRSELAIDIGIRDKIPPLRIFLGGDNVLDDLTFYTGLGFEFDDQDLKYLVGLLGAGT
jgi:phospholipid/cholesterol/gamma-HCH transport system substrate-binding protein